MLGLAARSEALDFNPVRALTLEEAVDLRARIHADHKAEARDIIDLTDAMLATGERLGETTLMDKAGLSARQVADQLGQADITTKQRHYLRRKKVTRDAARVLDAIPPRDSCPDGRVEPDDKGAA